MIILEFFNPEYLKIFSSLLLNKVIKNNCVVIKNIKGNNSNIYVGEFNKDKYIGKKVLTLISLKKSNSPSKLRIKVKQNIIIKT